MLSEEQINRIVSEISEDKMGHLMHHDTVGDTRWTIEEYIEDGINKAISIIEGGEKSDSIMSDIIIAKQSEATSLPNCPNCETNEDVQIEEYKCINCDSYW